MTPEEKYDLLEKEFEKFVYITSHDLRAPLRQIGAFMDLFIKSIDVNLDENQALYKSMMMECVEDAQAIVDVLVEYARLHVSEQRIADISVDQCLHESLALLSDVIKEKNAKISIAKGADLTMHGDTALLKKAFFCLVDNALKFHKAQTPPQLSIHAYTAEEKTYIAFEDNGIGLAADKFEIASTILKQLHPKGDYAGRGAGLAFVKKIAHLHGGDVQVENKGTSGTTIIIALKAGA